MQNRLNLNGNGWQLKGYLGEDWRWRDAHKPELRDAEGWIPATVPGSVYHDLWQAGRIPDPYRGQNTLLAEWASSRTWLYRRQFTVAPEWQGKRVCLTFEGVDYEATFYLNGQAIGHHRSMFTPATFEVGHLLQYGESNTLAVVLEPAPHEQPQVGRSSLVRTHKTRMNYWWDFCPRLVHLGLWDNVYLEASGPVRIEDVFVRPHLDEDHSHARLETTITASSVGEQMVTFQVAVREADGAGEVVATDELRRRLPPGETSHVVQIALQNPSLWWLNGFGPQSLYELSVSVLLDEAAQLRASTEHIAVSQRAEAATHTTISDARQVTFGVREIHFEQNKGAPDGARPYTLRINGRRIYIKGWNWVPIDLLYGVERPAKLERLLRLAQRADVNMLRIWGGGLIEKQAFYDLCNRLGILVWQEFVQSSSGIENVPPTDRQFIAMMVEEARAIVPRLRNHPSLAIWGGGNELQDAQGRPQTDDHPLLAALKAVVQTEDPDRYWLPTSPTGPQFGNTLENLETDPDSLHDVHGPWIYEGLEAQYELFNRSTSLLNSEFGVEAITNLRTLNDVIPLEQQRPIQRANPFWNHLGSWWIWEKRWDQFWGGLTERPTPEVVRATQFLQAEGLRYAIEAIRRRKFHNSGSLPWQFNEPYPNASCTSAIDYYANPKPVYHAVARAYAPLLLSARFPRIAWGGHDRFQATIWSSHSAAAAGAKALVDVQLEAQLRTIDGAIFARQEQTFTVPAGASAEHMTMDTALPAIADNVFFLDLLLRQDNAILAQSRYPFSNDTTLAPFLTLPSARLAIRKEQCGQNEWRLSIANNGKVVALALWLDVVRDVRAPGYAYYDDNFFHLMPGEEREIRVLWSGIPPSERCLSLQSWNAEEQVVYE